MQWDIFCRVIDNHGDLGVCWRLAADLASRGEAVRLWVDEPAALAWMAPHGAPGVTLIRWLDPLPAIEPGEVVIEAFGCDPPAGFVARMAARPAPPLWINLEYLSAGLCRARHGLPSPRPMRATLERVLLPRLHAAPAACCARGAAERRLDPAPWLAARARRRTAGREPVLLRPPALPALLVLRRPPDPGAQARPPRSARRSARAARGRRAQRLPWPRDCDRLLWSCDLTRARRGLVRARAMPARPSCGRSTAGDVRMRQAHAFWRPAPAP
jgi:hypothetical protein